MNKRIKQVRKELKLTQDEFGLAIGITGSAISKLESGASGITEQLLKSVCKEFDVDYIWLTTGEGEMFIEQSFEDMAVAETITNTLLSDENEFVKNAYKILARYSLEDWKALEHVVTKSAEYLEAIKKGE